MKRNGPKLVRVVCQILHPESKGPNSMWCLLRTPLENEQAIVTPAIASEAASAIPKQNAHRIHPECTSQGCFRSARTGASLRSAKTGAIARNMRRDCGCFSSLGTRKKQSRASPPAPGCRRWTIAGTRGGGASLTEQGRSLVVVGVFCGGEG